MGKKSGVTTKLLVEQPKALVTHCQGCSLSLAVKDHAACCKILCNTMSTVREICVLVKHSPKRKNILGTMQENFKVNFDPDTEKFLALEILCPTRWTVRASCFQNIIDNYCLLLKLWDRCLKESLEAETRSRIIGCNAQMKTFNFFFGLCLGQRHYTLTDNLSKTLQKEMMPAV